MTVTHDGKRIAEVTGGKVPNPWDQWLEAQRQSGLRGLPDWMREIHRNHGLDPKQACKGCVHLRKRFFASDTEPSHDGFTCTYHGTDEQEVKPDWPACGTRETSQDVRTESPRHKRNRQRAG